MKRRSFLHTAGVSGFLGLTLDSQAEAVPVRRKKLFSFIFYSDVHIQPEQGAPEGFLKAIAKMNSLKPDFVMSGGDNVMDALGTEEARVMEYYDLYLECTKKFAVPVYNVMGNHEVFGIYIPNKVIETHPLWGKELFKKRIGQGSTYRSFDHKGVHFMMLDSVGIVKNSDKPGHRYIGQIGEEQLAWIKTDLAKLPPNTPVISAAHIPIFSFYTQIVNGFTEPTPDSEVITDAKPLMEAFAPYCHLAHFEGHMHITEQYSYFKTKYFDTGAVSAGWWGGPFHNHPEGFNLVTVYNDGIEAEYISYGWDASKYKTPEKKSELLPEWWGRRRMS
jgi:3',5'-cyclic-AMP phosphodiesterase